MNTCRWCHTHILCARARLFPSSCHVTSFPSQAVLKPPSKKDAPVNVVRCALTRCGKTKQLKIVLQNIPNSHFLITHLMTQFQVNRIAFVLFCHIYIFSLVFCISQSSFRNFCMSLCTKEWATTCRGMNSSSFSFPRCSL